MSNPLKHPAVTAGGVVIVAAAISLIIWNQFDLGAKWDLSQSVDDLANGRQIEAARTALMETPRGPTIEALKEVLDSDEGTPWGKIQVLQVLSQFKESRVVARSLESKQLTTRRAAAYLRQTDESVAAQVSEIAMEWLKDKGSVDRRLAVLIVRTTDYRAALPDLIEILDAEGKEPDSARMMVYVLEALGQFKPEGIAPKVMELASDTSVETAVRNRALGTLTHLNDTPREELLKVLIGIAQDTGANINMRKNAVKLLGWPANATPEAWEVLRTILLDSDNSEINEQTLQRGALWSLSASYPLDKLRELVMDRRLYAHPYFGVRTDVACAIGNLGIRSRLALQVLTEMVAEEDAGDLITNVPRQAWISFWTLTGMQTGAERPELFRRQPKQITDEGALRHDLFSIGFTHPTITKAQHDALAPFTVTMEDNRLRPKDSKAFESLRAEKWEKRKAIAQLLRAEIDRIVARWEDPKGPKKPPAKDGDDKPNKDD